MRWASLDLCIRAIWPPQRVGGINGALQGVLLGSMLALAACAPAAEPSPTAKPAAPAPAADAAKPAAPAAKPNIPREVIDGATREGQLRLYWTSTATEEWRQKFQDAFNEYYGLKVTISDTRGNDWARDTAKVISEAAAGQKPAWDVMLTTESHHSDLFHNGLLGQHKFKELFGVPGEAIMYQGGAFTYANQIALPAYNKNLVKPEDVPKSWEDLLDPKWKDKIGVSVATHHWARLSQIWGDDKTTQYVTRLAALNPSLNTPSGLNQKLELGEVQLLATQIDTFIRVSREKNGPVVWAESISPVLVQSMMVGPLKDGPNPNAALLFAGFLASERGQKLWQDFQAQSSIYAEGSPYNKLVKGKEVVVLTEEFIEKELEPRTAKYGKILGFR